METFLRRGRLGSQAHGVTHGSVHRDVNNPDTIFALHRFKDMQGAKEFLGAVRAIWDEHGAEMLVYRPEIWLGEDIEQQSYSYS